jgi:dephospho-CoA kinase
MFTIGLTGGIGSGKSAVATIFAQLGIDIIDTDIIAHEIVEPGSPAHTKIIEHFGSTITNPDQTLNRKMLANKIFNHIDEKIWLEQLLHPLIRDAVEIAKEKATSPYCIVVIPLLIETLPNPSIDRILVVDSPKHLQISRTHQRDQRTAAEIMAIIGSQATSEERLAIADDVIINDQGLAELRAAVTELHQKYLKLSRAP